MTNSAAANTSIRAPRPILRNRIITSFSIVIALLGVVVVISVQQLNKIVSDEKYLFSVSRPTLTTINEVKSGLIRSTSSLQNMIIYQQPSYNSERESIWEYKIIPLIDSLNNYEKRWRVLEDRTLWGEVAADLRKFQRYQNELSEDLSAAGVITPKTSDLLFDFQIQKDSAITDSLNTLYESPFFVEDTASYDPQTANANIDLEIGIPGIEIIQDTSAGTNATQNLLEKNNQRIFEIQLADNIKASYQRKIVDFSQRILQKIDRLYNNYSEQVVFDNQALASHIYQLKLLWIGSLLLIVLLSVFLLRGLIRNIQKSLGMVRDNLQDLAKGKIPPPKLHYTNEIETLLTDSQHLANNLKKLQDLSQKIGSGNFNTQISVFENDSEIGRSIQQMQDGLRRVAQQDQVRNWTNEGLTLFAEILRNVQDPQSLFDSLARNLVRYVGANACGIYILKKGQEMPHLEMRACYAYEKKRIMHQKIYPGQGLVGQCWQEGLSIFLLKIPENYIHIGSGLGYEAPKSVLIVPIKRNNQVFGVIELASFSLLSQKEKDFLEAVAEDVASAISSIEASEQNKLLLAESTQITELMVSQEERMKESLQQLAIAQEELEKRTYDLEAMMRAISQAAIVIELDKQGNFIKVNDRFLEVSGYQREEVVGQHRSFYAPHDADPAEFNLLWTQLMQGVSMERNIRRLRKNNTEFWMRCLFFPMLDNHGELSKVTCICTDITDRMAKEAKALEEQKTLGFKNAALDHSFLIFETNHNFIVKHVNDFACKTLGFHKEHFVNVHIDEHIIGRLDFKNLLMSLENNYVEEGMLLIKASNFQFKYINFIVAGVKNQQQELENIFFIGTDLTESKRKEFELTNIIEKLQLALKKQNEKVVIV